MAASGILDVDNHPSTLQVELLVGRSHCRRFDPAVQACVRASRKNVAVGSWTPPRAAHRRLHMAVNSDGCRTNSTLGDSRKELELPGKL